MYPDEWERFLTDPYAHRAPRAESYHDLSGRWADHHRVNCALNILGHTVRLESVIFELERCQDDLLIIGHASVIRCLVRSRRVVTGAEDLTALRVAGIPCWSASERGSGRGDC